MRWTNPRPTPGFWRRFAERVVETHVAKGQLRGELPVGESLARAYGSIETSVSRVSGGPFEFSILFGTSMVAGTGTDSHTRTQQAWLRSVRAPAGIMETKIWFHAKVAYKISSACPVPCFYPAEIWYNTRSQAFRRVTVFRRVRPTRLRNLGAG